MEPNIVVALISLLGIIASSCITALMTRDQFNHELDKRLAIIDTKLVDMANDLRENKQYSKLYSETMPVVQEQIKVINHRLDAIEKKLNN